MLMAQCQGTEEHVNKSPPQSESSPLATLCGGQSKKTGRVLSHVGLPLVKGSSL